MTGTLVERLPSEANAMELLAKEIAERYAEDIEYGDYTGSGAEIATDIAAAIQARLSSADDGKDKDA